MRGNSTSLSFKAVGLDEVKTQAVDRRDEDRVWSVSIRDQGDKQCQEKRQECQ